jgi:hypothetical protein
MKRMNSRAINSMFTRFIGLLVALGIGLGAIRTPLWGTPGEAEEQSFYPFRIQGDLKIDGVLDDKAWQQQPLEKDFISYYPGYGEKMSQETLIWMAYDNKNLYFAFLCYDSQPQKIKTSLTKRDQMYDDDWVGISIDALGNNQSQYSFYINPYGIQGDILLSAVSGEDKAPDFVWESAGKITPQGYQVEVLIPLSSIRFRSGKEVKMGVLFKRKSNRLGFRGSWPEIKPGVGALNATAPIIYKNLKPPLKMEILPSVTYSSNQERINALAWGGSDRLTNLGIGIKYGITSSISAELTVNPDYNQVESDSFQVEVNQRYPLFYSEKRPFFMEGADIFNFFTLAYGFLPNAVHTRRIVDPLGGVKLSGILGKASFGILATLDQPQDQKAFFGIARGKYSLGKDNYVGFLYSSREASNEYNRVVGVDMGYRLFKNHRTKLSFLYSMSGGVGPDSKESPADNSWDFNFSYFYSSKTLSTEAVFEHIDKDFRMDTAYLLRTGLNEGWIWAGYFFYPDAQKLPWFKLISPEIFLSYLHDLYTNMDDTFFDLAVNFRFNKQGVFALHYKKAKESWLEKIYDLNRFEVNGGIQLTNWLGLEGRLSWGESIYYEAVPSFLGRGYEGFLSLVFQPNKNLNQQFSLSHSDLSRGREELYDVNILYSRTTYQFSKYFFLRAVLQYDSYQKRMLTDFLASFTLIPGTVLHVGYGGLYESRKWQDNQWLYRQGDLLNIKRSFFLKASYLWRF